MTAFEVMEKLGVPWNDEAEHAYLMLWDRVGELLGIGTPEVWKQLSTKARPKGALRPLRPQTVAEARALQDLIRARVWPLPARGAQFGPFDNAGGKVLVRALLDELQEAMPRGLLRLPLVVMRYLVHPTAHELLGLGGGGLPDSVMRWPSVERFIRGPAHRPGTGLVERTMRIAATDISRRAFIHFIRERKDDAAVGELPVPWRAVERHRDLPRQGRDRSGVTGTTVVLTLLFTDIEGSTLMWEQDSKKMEAAVAIHFELLQRAITDHHGSVVKKTGDGVFATFGDPLESVARWPWRSASSPRRTGQGTRSGCGWGCTRAAAPPVTATTTGGP